MANSMTYKTYTAKRMENMRACDGKNYKFTADWSKPQSKTVCQSALKSISDKLSRIAKQKTWGSKEDTPALIAELISLIPTAQLGSDDMQNSFLCYQTERYFLRIWWRGTAEEREKIAPKTKAPAKKTKKTETAAPAPAPASKAPAKKAPAKKAPAKKPLKTETAAPAPESKAPAKKNTKIASALPKEVVPEWDEMQKKSLAYAASTIDSGFHVETNEQYVADVMNVLTDMLVNELTDEQKRKFVSALTIALQQSF